MVNDYSIKIAYKNRSLDTVSERTYSLPSYCTQLKYGIMRSIVDIENAFYRFQNGKSKEEWDPETQELFHKIRHKLLDSANSVERLPQNLCCNGVNINSVDSAEYFANIINQQYQNK